MDLSKDMHDWETKLNDNEVSRPALSRSGSNG